jgi:hypothetical protein
MDGFNICAVTPLPYKRKKEQEAKVFVPKQLKQERRTGRY